MKYGHGKVPVQTGDPIHPIRLIDFPAWEVFETLYSNQVPAETKARNYEILSSVYQGATLTSAAAQHGITKERVRQIQQKFLHLLNKQFSSVTA